MLLGDILLQSGKASRRQIEEALARQAAESPPRRLGEILMDAGVVAEQDLLEALGRQFGIPFEPNLRPEWLEPDLVRDLPVEWARTRQMLPVRRDGILCVALSDPTDLAARDDLALLLGGEAQPLLTPAPVLREMISRCYFQRRESGPAFNEETAVGGDGGLRRIEADDLLTAHGDAPVSKLVNMILLEALRRRASDVHLEPLEDRLRLRYRIDGLLYDQSPPPGRFEEALVSRLKVMGHLDIAEKRLPQDGMARVRIGDQSFDVRISTIPVASGERVVLRLLQRESALLPLGDLGMPPAVAEAFRAAISENAGAVWVTGPTGSGKTTTLYAALQELDTVHRNILTIEDPVEYQLPNIGQMAVKPRIGLTFSRGLRHLLRQDPDVILVGETRDLETAEIAVRASLTGHLVLSTLHTHDACGALLRLVDMGVPAYLVSAATTGVLAQRLVRRLCTQCRVPAGPEGLASGPLARAAATRPGAVLYEPRGCDVCLGGYRGRIGLYEFLRMQDALHDALRAGVSSSALHAAAERQGMATLAEDAVSKLAEGLSSTAEMARVVGGAAP